MKLLRPNKQYSWLLVIFALCFTGFGIRSLWQFQAVSAWPLIVTSVLLVFFLLFSLLPNSSYLILRKGGFHIRYMFSVRDHKWTDVAKFFIGRRFSDRGAIFYLLKSKSMLKVKVFPDNYGLPPNELYELLDLWWNSAVGNSEEPSDGPYSEFLEPQASDPEQSPLPAPQVGIGTLP